MVQIAYMDFLDFSSDYANHHNISYKVPRFCNVSSADFSFVATVDRNLKNPGRPSFGVLPVSFIIYTLYYFFILTIHHIFLFLSCSYLLLIHLI